MDLNYISFGSIMKTPAHINTITIRIRQVSIVYCCSSTSSLITLNSVLLSLLLAQCFQFFEVTRNYLQFFKMASLWKPETSRGNHKIFALNNSGFHPKFAPNLNQSQVESLSTT